MNYKKILAGALAISMAASLTACGDSTTTTTSGDSTAAAETDVLETTTEATEWTGDTIEVETSDYQKLDVDIEGQVLTWLGIYDLNPTNDSPERSTELALFEDTYGATIEYIPTTSSEMFNSLATNILGGTSPDIFIYQWRSFPYDISKGQYQSIDSLVDWTDPKWADVKDIADTFIYNGEHYIAPLTYSFTDIQVLMYNKTVVEDEGLDDPYELYLAGEWDWDVFVDMMKTYVEQGDGSVERYGIGGWWANAFVYTAGETMVTYDGTSFANNLRSTKIEKAQTILEDLSKNSLVKRGWISGDSAFVTNDILFYAMGTWAYDAAAQSMPDDVIQIVPFPREPENDQYYVSNTVVAYMWVRGSTNADCVAAWLDVNRAVYYYDSYTEATKEKYLANNPGWTSEMYDLVMSFYDSDKFAQAYDYGYGLSTLMSDDVMSVLYEGIINENFENWVQTREEYYSLVDEEIATANEEMQANS